MFAAHLRIDRFDFRLRLRSRNSRRESADNPETARVTRLHLVFRKREWLPNFRAPAKLTSAAEIEKLEGKIETCGHHAHNGETFAVEKKLRPDDLRIIVEPSLPQPRTDDHNIIAAQGAFFRLEKSAFDR